jgi:hypothetical protein
MNLSRHVDDLGEPRMRPQPRLVLSRGRAMAIVLVIYASVILGATWLFGHVGSSRGDADGRVRQVAWIFAALLGLLCVRSMVRIYRSRVDD